MKDYFTPFKSYVEANIVEEKHQSVLYRAQIIQETLEKAEQNDIPIDLFLFVSHTFEYMDMVIGNGIFWAHLFLFGEIPQVLTTAQYSWFKCNQYIIVNAKQPQKINQIKKWKYKVPLSIRRLFTPNAK